jgi:mycothiol synthase
MTGRDAASTVRPFATSRPIQAIPGLVLRHLIRPDDYPGMNAVANAARAAAGEDFYTSDDQMRVFYENLPNSDPARDVAVIELGGRVVAYGRAGWRQELNGLRVYEVIPFLAPTAPDELLPLLLAALEDRLREIAAEHPAGEKVLETSGSDGTLERETLVRQAGYEAIRYYYSMVRPSVDDLPDAPLPAGLEIREVLPEHLDLIWAADQEAFRDHWGYAPATEGDYQQFLTDPVMSDASLWRIAWDGDEVAGQVRSFINAEENERRGHLRGWVEHISVRRPWRRRGLARALIAASFPLLRARGMTEAALGVDTENTSGALHVYERCGFQPVSRSAVYRKPLDA